jgi:glycopeptide antibiotics resistance protein
MGMTKQEVRTTVTMVIFAVYLSLLGYIVFFAGRRTRIKETPAEELVYLIPLKKTIATYCEIQPGQTRELVNFHTNLLGNIALFFPLPFFLASTLKINTWKRILMLVLITSLLIEVSQYIFNVGVTDIDDVILNVCGGAIGYLALRTLLRLPGIKQN